ncbi:MAG: prenyltransferase [Candidatus Thermoplasmatota archaeon]|nr:prenyltransferase [Candidatus Thermoplasmatota archaeon]MCL5681178.1 prenyltransferase [Candidatus Thermoplasmatota archaeon]
MYLFVAYILPGAVFVYRVMGHFEWVPFVLVSVSILPLMVATNLYDDYFDMKYGYDRPDSPNTTYRKHPVYFHGVNSTYLLKWAIVASAIYFALFTTLAFFLGAALLAIAVLGFILAYGYTGPPFGYKYLGIGGIGVFLSTILISMMIFYSEAHYIPASDVLFSIPYAVILLPVLFLGDFRDMEYDRKLGFRTQPNLMGRKWSLRYPTIIFIIFFALLLLYIALGIYPILSILELVTVPIVFYSLRKWSGMPTYRIENFMGNVIFLCLAILSVLLL